MAFQFGQPYIDPHNGQEYHEAIGKIIFCKLFFRSDGITPCARVRANIYGNQQQMEQNLQPVDTVEKIITGPDFGEIFWKMWESVSEPAESNELARIEQNLGVIFGEQFVETNIVPTDADQEIRIPKSLFSGTEEQVCQEAEVIQVWVPAGQVWWNSKLYVNEEPGDTQVHPSGFVWDNTNSDGYWRQWQANEGNTDGFYVGPLNPCGGGPSGCVEWEIQLGEEPQQVGLYVKNESEEISAFHIQGRPLGEIMLESAVGGEAEGNGFQMTVFNNEDPEGISAQSLSGISFSDGTIPPNPEFIHLCTLNYSGDVVPFIEDMQPGSILVSARTSFTNYEEGALDTNFDWPDSDGVLNVLDIVGGIGFLGAQFGLTGIEQMPNHNMSKDNEDGVGGGIENIASAINMVLDGSSVEKSRTTNYCDVEW